MQNQPNFHTKVGLGKYLYVTTNEQIVGSSALQLEGNVDSAIKGDKKDVVQPDVILLFGFLCFMVISS